MCFHDSLNGCKFHPMCRIKIIFIILLFLGILYPEPRKECGMDEILTQQDYLLHISDYPGIPLFTRDILWVPVTFHVVRMDNGSGGLSQARLNTGIEDLNNAAGDSNMRYYQLGETDYIDYSNFYSGIDTYEEIDSLRTINNIPNTLNIYSTANLNNGNYDLCGISTFSWYESQGIVMANSCFATSDNHTTLPHEVGHFFDLYHTHQGSGDPDGDGIIDGQNAEFVDGTECEIRGDGLCDTPADPVLSDLVTGNCTYIGSYLDGHLEPYDPDTHNLMSYSVKHCRDVVTASQYDKMIYTYQTYRPELNIPPLIPNITLTQFMAAESSGDGDGVINPGETAEVWVTLENHPDWPDASSVEVLFNTNDSDVIVTNGSFFFSELAAGEMVDNSSSPFIISFDTLAGLGVYNFDLTVHALGTDDTEFQRIFPVTIDLTLFQNGWPIYTVNDTINQIQGSPVVVDANSDGIQEIFFADYNGTVFSVNPAGEGITNDLFPFHAGNSVWGDLASADVDNDDHIEVVVTSKDKHLYILDIADQVLKLDYHANQFLISTPALGNADEDPDLEIFFGGFSSTGKLFCIDADGTDLPGFPKEINEKIRGGIAIADLNGNGKDDIVFGTEGYRIWLVYDNGMTATGFPITTDGKVRTAPAILKTEFEDFILSGDDAGYVYALNQQGEPYFSYYAGGGITTGFAFVDQPWGTGIFFGTDNGEIHGINLMGDLLAGWPVAVGGEINSTPVFSDLNSDGEPELICGNSMGIVIALHISGEPYVHYPIQIEFQIMSSPTISDIDLDGDAEILIGTTHTALTIDVKQPGNTSGFWNTFQGDYYRAGLFSSTISSGCDTPQQGDLNCDGSIDVLDVVRLVQIIVHPDEISPSDFEIWAGDINSDEIIDILDVVSLVNLIIS
ncbi:MAG: hypothetical protein ACE5D7_00430 [Fidelibacterota bacterium]